MRKKKVTMRKKVYYLIVLDECGDINVRTTTKYPSVKDLQAIINGRNVVKVKLNLQGYSFWMIFDYDGGFNNKKFNRRASEVYGDQIFGPAVILQEDGEEMAAFTKNLIPYIVNHMTLTYFYGGANGTAVKI